MAIKISGNTVIDDSQNITATGSATIDGSISLPNISLNEDGSAIFTSTNPVVTDQPSTGNAANPAIQIKHDGTINGSWRHDGRLEVGGQDANAEITLSPDGSITNKNFINVRNENSSLGAVYIGNADGNAARNNVAFEISPTLTSNDAKVRLNYDGSASFASVVTGTADYNTFTASVTLANEGSSFRSTESSAGSASKYHFLGTANGTNVCNIATDGSATFAGGGAVINSYGQLVITRSDSNAYPSLTINSAGTTTNTIDLNGDGSATFAGTITSNGGVSFTGGQLVESVNVTAGTLASASDIDLSTGMVHYFTTQESTQVTPNLMVSGKSVNQIMAVGEAISVVIMLTASASGYLSSLTIDGSPVTPMWSNGIAPSEGGASGIDVYSLQVIKTANSTYTVVANSSNFA